MKRSIAAVLAGIMLVSCLLLSGCGRKSTAYDYDLDAYITLPDYQNLRVDTTAQDYQMGLAYENYSNLSELGLDDVITETELTDGTVQVLDTVNIDYIGKKDGVAFDGGTAEGYDLQIGSSSFIEGFESGLIGVKIGETVDLNLTFPENYSSADLAGAKVVFTVTVNSLVRPTVSKITAEIAEALGYGSATEYQESLENNYLSNYIWADLVNNTEVKQYPEQELTEYIDANIAQLEAEAEANSTTLDVMLSSYGMTEADYREQMEPYANSYVLQNMITYSIARKENLVIEDSDVDEYMETNYAGQTYTDFDRQSVYESMLRQEVIAFLTAKAEE